MWANGQGHNETGNSFPDRDPSQTVRYSSGLHYSTSTQIRETVGDIQRQLDPEAAAMRSPLARKLQRVPLTSAGPNEVWCCDGHDKLCRFGFAIWGVRDKFSRKWLGLWVLPNNRIGVVVAYLWLSLVRDLGGESSSFSGTLFSFICM
jgi:hypothetical protein